jgi:hypothetical protein
LIQPSGKYADVQAFTNDVPTLRKIPIVDGICAYDCKLTAKTYLLVIRNALQVESMEHSLIPPFLMREAGLYVNECAKRHCESPTIDEHCIYDEETKLRIHLGLRGIFSVFPTRPLTAEEILNCDAYDVVFLTPDSDEWNPNNEQFAEEEEACLDSEGNITEPVRMPGHHLIEESDIDIGAVEASPMTWNDYEDRVDAVISSSEGAWDGSTLTASEAAEYNDDPVPVTFADMDLAAHLAKLSAAAGSTWVDDDGCELFESKEFASALADAIVKGGTAISALSLGDTSGIDPEHLSKIWSISPEQAEKTLKMTTQFNKQDPDSTLSRNFGTNDRMLRRRRIKSTFFTDTFFVTKKAKSSRGNVACQLYVSDKGYIAAYPMKSESKFLDTLKMFSKDVGAPEVLVADPAKTQKKKEVKDYCIKIGTRLRILEEATQWANRAELYIGMMKEGVRKDIRVANAPLVFWDYAVERRAMIANAVPKDLFQLQGMNPHTATFGTEMDISQIAVYGFYEWVYHRQGSAPFPFNSAELGRVLAPCKNEGNEMTFWVLKGNGQIVPRRSLRRLTAGEASSTNETEARKRDAFDTSIRQVWGDSFTLPTNYASDDTFQPYEDDEQSPATVPEAEAVDANGKPIMTQPITDVLINAEVLLSQGESEQLARVVRRCVDENGKLVGQYDKNPLISTQIYECEFPDGTIKEYGANIIAENLLTKADPNGYYSQQLEAIIDHKRDGNALRREDMYVKGKNGRKSLRKSTSGWELQVKWTNGSTQWVPLKLL